MPGTGVRLIWSLKPAGFRHISRERLTQIIEGWQINAIKLNNMILQDATKEFDQNSRFGYGIDGDERINTLDFEAVRGSYEGNKFVAALKAENKSIEERALKLKDILQNEMNSDSDTENESADYRLQMEDRSQSAHFFQSFSISSRVFPLVSGTSFHMNTAARTLIMP
jgi:hypothetical protein